MAKPASAKRRLSVKDIVADKDAVILRHRDNGPLHDLLLRACPPNRNGEKSITILANKLKLSSWSVHKWIQNGKIPPKRAVEVVDISDGRVALADFSPFIYV
jgi:hypothetical protein